MAVERENGRDHLRVMALLVATLRESQTSHACGCDFDLGWKSVLACLRALQVEAYVSLVDSKSLRLRYSWEGEG